jgi:DNA-binding response OmpR family regulator
MDDSPAATVLTVDDDPIVRADLRLVLEDAGFDVLDAADGVEAVDATRRDAPDVLLLDLVLPRLDGIDVIRRISSEHVVPIVALTGQSQRLAEQALHAGASAFVLKPFHPEEVVCAVRDALSAHRGRPLESARAESRRALADLVTLLGYPADWADELEARAYRSGMVWRRSR